MNTSAEKTCWVCTSRNARATIRFNDWQVYRCDDCGFRFAEDGQPLVYDEHYDEDYFVPFTQRDQTDKWSQIYAERLKYLQHNAPSSTLLEAGAGASVFALSAQSYGFTVNVVDAAPWAIRYLTSHPGVTGEVADLNSCTLPAGTYGAIHCAHVLEHLNNPRGFLEQCYQCLQDGGLMYLSFPAYEGRILGIKDWLYRLRMVNYPYNYMAPDHVSYFDADCIRRTVSDVGFEVVRLRRRKFISLYDSAERISTGGLVRRMLGAATSLSAPVTRRIGFHRDLELILKRPYRAAANAA